VPATTLNLDTRSEAVLDECRENRFLLLRIWNDRLPRVVFCLTNPSTADESVDDPTARKVQTYGRLWGYGSVAIVNTFSWRCTNPRELPVRRETPETVQRNFQHIEEAARAAHLVVCGWGRWGALGGRARAVRTLLRPFSPSVLRLISNGEPEHPLYLPLALKPTHWDLGPSH